MYLLFAPFPQLASAVSSRGALKDIDYAKLRELMLKVGQLLE